MDRNTMTVRVLPRISELGGSPLYSEELGIELKLGRDRDTFGWFMASILYGARISKKVARSTYHVLVRRGLTTPGKILDAGWDFLADPVMCEGGDGDTMDASRSSCCAIILFIWRTDRLRLIVNRHVPALNSALQSIANSSRAFLRDTLLVQAWPAHRRQAPAVVANP